MAFIKKGKTFSTSKLFLGRLFFIYSILIFVVTTIVIASICWVYNLGVKNKYQRCLFFHSLSHYWTAVLFAVLFVRVKKTIAMPIKKDEAHIYIANHASLLDIWMSTPMLPQANFTIGKNSFGKIPIFGIIYKMGAILVDRKNANSRLQSFIALEKCLKNGMSICIYPEGSRNQSSNTLLPFQNGAFKLSKMKNIDIIPVCLLHTNKVFPANIPFYFYPGKVEMHFLKPINPNDYETEATLKNACYDVMTMFIESKR